MTFGGASKSRTRCCATVATYHNADRFLRLAVPMPNAKLIIAGTFSFLVVVRWVRLLLLVFLRGAIFP
jgi:hypothetical protein